MKIKEFIEVLEKNNLLKDEKFNYSLLQVYNEQLAIAGSNIIYLRKKFLSEIEKIAIMDELPINWTYPEIQPKLLEEARKRGFLPKKEEIKWLFFDDIGLVVSFCV